MNTHPHRPFEEALQEIKAAEMNKIVLRLKSTGGKSSLGHILSESLQDYILKSEPKKSSSDVVWLDNFIKNCVPLRETESPYSWTPVTLLDLHNVPERSFISFMCEFNDIPDPVRLIMRVTKNSLGYLRGRLLAKDRLESAKLEFPKTRMRNVFVLREGQLPSGIFQKGV